MFATFPVLPTALYIHHLTLFGCETIISAGNRCEVNMMRNYRTFVTLSYSTFITVVTSANNTAVFCRCNLDFNPT